MRRVNCEVAVRLPIPPGSFKAYLFDCDGTVADSMPLHYLAWRQALGKWGCTFAEERFYELGGVPIIEIIERLGREQGIEMPIAQVAKRKEELYYEHLPKLKCVPEVLEHIELQHGRIRVRGSLGKHTGVGRGVVASYWPPGEIRRAGLCGRLREEQA